MNAENTENFKILTFDKVWGKRQMKHNYTIHYELSIVYTMQLI